LAEENNRRDSQVYEVRSVRRYILHNARWSEDATLEALFTVGTNNASYTILNTTAKGLQKEVLKRILDGEIEAFQKREAEIIPEHYDVKLAGVRTIKGKPCEALELSPRKKSKYLLNGWACADANEKAIVHVEGESAKSVSFWVGKIYVTQEFRKIGTFWYSSVSRSTADVRFLGKTDLTIQYLDYQITPKQGPAVVACRTTGCSPALHRVPITQVTSAPTPDRNMAASTYR